jgi:hypothetical protein
VTASLAEAATPRGITCPDYDAAEGSRRCRDFLQGGGCARADRLECTEWRKANPLRPRASELPASPPLAPRGLPVPPAATDAVVTRDRVEALALAPPRASTAPTFLSAADVASFRDLGAEVCLASPELGSVWIVAAPTGQDRRELTPEQLAVLVNACIALPGAHVVAIDRRR